MSVIEDIGPGPAFSWQGRHSGHYPVHCVPRLPRTLSIVLLFLAAFLPSGVSAEAHTAHLVKTAEAITWTSPSGNVQIRFDGNATKGFDVDFQTEKNGRWQTVASFEPGKVWSIFTEWDRQEWDPHWYSGEHNFKIAAIRLLPDQNSLECSGSGTVNGDLWVFKDIYAFQDGAIKVARSWHHVGPSKQTPITLATRLRVKVGNDARWMLPGIIYNDNPGTYPTRQVPHLPHVPFAKGVYEEHRFPVPFVNVESEVKGSRTYASILSVPSRVPSGHRGQDQWWSMGLQWLWGGDADLLLLSGAVTTNGMNSTVYGHLNGFDPFDGAYIDVKGNSTFEKTFYIDVGLTDRAGYGFRQTLWKAIDIFHPFTTESMPFSEAMDQKFQYATKTYKQEPSGAAGFPLVPDASSIPPEFHRLTYGWVGRNLAVAYSLLRESDRTQDERLREMGLSTVRYFVNHVRQDSPGLLFGDYAIPSRTWVGFLGLPDWPESISSRQLGEILDSLAELTLWARKHDQADAAAWQALLVSSGDYLVSAKRYKGMYPRAWYPDGEPVGWENGVPGFGTVTASGAFLVAPLVKIYEITGDRRYLLTAEDVLRAYYLEFARDLKMSYAGATLDAACEDKEAGQGFLHGAITLYEATKKAEYLNWARDAADWVLTWYYVYDVDFPTDAPLHGIVNTIGWTTTSVQNEVIDMFGAYSSADLFLLGTELHDDRYNKIAQTLFNASTQTIARPGRMLGLPLAGMQFEHVTQTDYTHIRGGEWRGHAFVPLIIWPLGNTLFNGEMMLDLGAFER